MKQRFKPITIPLLLLMGIIIAVPVFAENISAARSGLEKAIEAEMAAQKKADQWSQEKQQMISEIRQLKTRLEWLSYQNKKYDAYIKTEEQAIAELKRKDAEMRHLRQALEPYLDRTIDELAAFIEKDLPFLGQERSRRVSFLKESVNDYHLAMSEKLHRVLEALNVETEYGRSIEADTRALNVQGRSVESDVLRVGRIALFYRSLDGREVGKMNPDTGTWEPVDKKFSRAIRDTIDMARQKKSVELVDLPIGGVEQ